MVERKETVIDTLTKKTEGDYCVKCGKCVVFIEAQQSLEPTCCAWFIDNVVCGDKSTYECEEFEPIEQEVLKGNE